MVSALGAALRLRHVRPRRQFVLRNLPSGPYMRARASARLRAGARPRGAGVVGRPRAAVDHAPEARGVTRRSAAGAGRRRRTAGAAPGDDESRGAGPPRPRRSGVAPAPFAAQRAEGGHRPGRLDGHALGSSPKPCWPGLGWAVEGSARLASALLPDLDVNGQFNLLTSTSFDRPQDLFSAYGQMPRGVAFLSLVAPGTAASGACAGPSPRATCRRGSCPGRSSARPKRRTPTRPACPTRCSATSAATPKRWWRCATAAATWARCTRYDNWKVSPRLQLTYGARYADYDYLDDERLFSPRAGIVVQPLPTDPTFRVRASASRSETAPGAVEFLPPVAGVWLPPERTFSSLGNGRLVPQRVDHVEAGVEQDIGPLIVSARAFRQQTTDQVVSVFGSQIASTSSRTGHYHVGSAGDFDAIGWGVVGRVRRGRPHAGVGGLSAGVGRVAAESAPVGGAGVGARTRSSASADRVHSLSASVESIVAPTETRLLRDLPAEHRAEPDRRRRPPPAEAASRCRSTRRSRSWRSPTRSGRRWWPCATCSTGRGARHRSTTRSWWSARRRGFWEV